MTETPQQNRVNTEHLRDYSQLRRSVTDRKIAGVAGGLGRHLNIDPTILRVAFVVLCFFGGAGFLLYGAAWLLVPEEGKDHAAIATSASTRNALLIAVGALAALLLIGDSWGGFGFPWPLVLIGVAVLLYLVFREQPMSNQTPPPPPPEQSPASPGDTGAVATYPPADSEPTTPYGAPPAWAPPAQPTYQAPVPRPDRGPKLFWVTLALVAIAVGTLGIFDVYGVSVPDGAYPALALAVIGTMLVVGAWFGRAGGLIFLGVVAALAMVAASATNPRFDGERVRQVTPATAAEVRDRYFIPAGTLRLDLSEIRDVEALDQKTIDVEANAGELVVIVPEGVDVNVDADIAAAGEADVAGRVSGGLDVHTERQIDGGIDAPEIDLNLDLVVGSIEVRQS
ncbi:MAG TPA: PspC domain-containing protein [Nocardioidaceae bacterium]|nr:PspC domain-containing protein [Nocardioidaceae bacterium]